jgi:hypothetical protein
LEQQIRKNTEKTLEGNPKKTLEKLWKNNKELTQHQMVGRYSLNNRVNETGRLRKHRIKETSS